MRTAEARKNETMMREAALELARVDLYGFCRLMQPKFYTEGKRYLIDACDQIQKFAESSSKHFLVINMPPRHGKSLTAQHLAAWLLGQNPSYRIMTASYNETLSQTFAASVRNMIREEKLDRRIVYSDIFPTQIQYGQASAARWSVEGQGQISYLATSPNGSATGIGCDFLICDDLIKNAEEAYNENALDKIWQWFTNTMLSRVEGKRKVIIIMTRWAEGDLAGRVLKSYDDVELITYKAVQDDGSMLCDEVLDRTSYDLITKEMNVDIAEANYNQRPIDIAGRIYSGFKEWEKLPEGQVRSFTDTADTGSDYLCSISYVVFQDEAYIKNIVFTDAAMEQTEEMVADAMFHDEVGQAMIESNNGGRGFRRNVERRLKEKYHSNKTIFTDKPQTHNKESRILASSAWVQNHVYMPPNWKQRFPEFAKQVLSYQRKGKNAHDDALDVLAAIYEDITDKRRVIFYDDSPGSPPRSDRVITTYY